MRQQKCEKILAKGFILMLAMFFLFKIGVVLDVFNTEWVIVIDIVFASFVVYIFIIQIIEDFN